MPIGQISDFLGTSRRPSESRDYLQSNLSYAKSVSDGNQDQVNQLLRRLADGSSGTSGTMNRSDETLLRSVKSQLEAQGFTVGEPSRNDIFAVDLAIENDAGDAFLIGIQCSSMNSPRLTKALHREVWRPLVMSRVYPRIHTVNAYGCLTDRSRELSALMSSSEQANTTQGNVQ